MNVKLLPCPFCGSSNVRLRHHDASYMSWISCVGCGLEAPTETGVTNDDAIAYWNRRTAALSHADHGGVKVKALEWTEPMKPDGEKSFYDHCTAESPFGEFRMEWKSWKGAGSGIAIYGPASNEYIGCEYEIEAAKAAAQADYEARILSAIDPAGVKVETDECQYSKDNNIPEHRCAVRCIYANEANTDGLKFPLASWKEQAAFEEWAKESHYEMHQHPLHYLFMDKQTNAARQGWKAALAFVRQLQAALTQAPAPTLTGEVEMPAPVTNLDALEAAKYLLWYKDKGGNTDHCKEAWDKLRTALAAPSPQTIDCPATPAEAFARWIEEGPVLAKAAGCYVGIKATNPSPQPNVISPHAFAPTAGDGCAVCGRGPNYTAHHPAPAQHLRGDGEVAIIECLAAGEPFVFDPSTNFLHADDGTVENGIRYVPAPDKHVRSNDEPIAWYMHLWNEADEEVKSDVRWGQPTGDEIQLAEHNGHDIEHLYARPAPEKHMISRIEAINSDGDVRAHAKGEWKIGDLIQLLLEWQSTDPSRVVRFTTSPAPQDNVTAPFNAICYGARFRYTDQTKVLVKIGHDLIAEWDASKVADKWIGQTVCSFSENGDVAETVQLVLDPPPQPREEPRT